MKALVVLLAVLGGVLLWRNGRRHNAPPSANPVPPAPQEMTRCAACGLHLPRNEAVAGRHALYCSAEHRQQAED